MLAQRCGRDTCVVALGGGVVGDMVPAVVTPRIGLMQNAGGVPRRHVHARSPFRADPQHTACHGRLERRRQGASAAAVPRSDHARRIFRRRGSTFRQERTWSAPSTSRAPSSSTRVRGAPCPRATPFLRFPGSTSLTTRSPAANPSGPRALQWVRGVCRAAALKRMRSQHGRGDQDRRHRRQRAVRLARVASERGSRRTALRAACIEPRARCS
jgi:hypothetical protein